MRQRKGRHLLALDVFEGRDLDDLRERAVKSLDAGGYSRVGDAAPAESNLAIEYGSRRLEPANETMSPIFVDEAQFRSVDILGKVVGVYRRMN